MLAGGVKSPVPLNELESHLRDDFEREMKTCSDAQQAFDVVVSRMGCPKELEREFKKVGPMQQALRLKAVWILIGCAFVSCWFLFGKSPALAIVYGAFLTGLIVASAVDFKRFIIPDEITVGGIIVGFLCSLFLPQIHEQKTLMAGMLQSATGLGVGAVLLYLILRAGKLAFGRERIAFLSETKITFTESTLILPDNEMSYEDLFHRETDAIELHARAVEFAGRSYVNVPVRLTSKSLQIGNEKFDSTILQQLQVATSGVVIPREAMGFGDVKFMAAIGAFLGWPAVVFSLLVSSIIGSLVNVGLIAARRRDWSARLPFGPYIAIACAIWIFGGKQVIAAILAP